MKIPKKKTKKIHTKSVKKAPHISRHRSFLKKVTQIHSGITIIMLLLYTGLGIFGGPEYMFRDIQNKYKALASTTTLTVRVVGPPGKPVVTTTPSCSGTNALILLNWAETSDTDNFDVYRDGSLLVSGITDDFYQDNNVQTEYSYTYYAIANGPLGHTQSDDVSATTGKCLITPTCQISSIDGKTFTGIPEITNRTPLFSGTTNLPNADIKIEIYSGPNIVANTTANLNGYWTWTVPSQLDYGTHTIYVTATDPIDPTRFVQISGQFIVQTEETGGNNNNNNNDNNGKKSATAAVSTTPTPISIIPTPSNPSPEPGTVPLPFEFKISVSNQQKTAYSGSNLDFDLVVTKNDTAIQATDVSFSIINSDGKVIKSWVENIALPEKTEFFQKSTALPKLLKEGHYKIVASANSNNITINAEDLFAVKERPLLNLGGGFVITFSVLLNYIGWLWLLLVAILVFLIILLSFEHYLSTEAAFHITEDYLKKKGVINGRKEVPK